jgi:putative Mg2+ transporter-C (MgtC) family protein
VAQIIPGIGFIGAGSILHSRGSVQGLTTAATIFVVASIGVAAGGGLYLAAIFAAAVILVALYVLGFVETRFSLKPLTMAYEIAGNQADEIVSAVNEVLEDEHKIMQTVQIGRTDHHFRVQFTVDATQREHSNILERLRHSPAMSGVECLGRAERE